MAKKTKATTKPKITATNLRPVDIALSFEGLKETGNNGGKQVNIFQAVTGNKTGDSWCMSFVVYCVGKAKERTGAPNPLKKTGGCIDQWNSRPKLRVSTPAPGDIFIIDRGGGKGHTGFVTAVNGDTIETIEGNSGPLNDGTADQVCRRIGGRKISTIKGFLRV